MSQSTRNTRPQTKPQASLRSRVPVLAIAAAALALSNGALDSTLRAEDPLPSASRLQSSPVLRHLQRNPVDWPPTSPAERTVAAMHVPPGFKVELVASEPALQQPVAFAWDERGRIWIAEAMSYPSKRPKGQGQDRIVILEDRDGDGRFETRKVFAEGLNLVSGLEVGFGGVWIGAPPQLLFLADRDHNDVPDGPPQVLLDGFGYQDTHECLNSFLWGPDGWLYGNQGVFNLAHIGRPGAPDSQRTELRAGVWRYHPVRHEFEVFASGGSNPWGLDYDDQGQLFMTHCRSYWGGGCTTHVIQGGHYWNQANANYAPFIIANPPKEFPGFKNYLLASARYDHGAGGAGAPGSDGIYGGHSHVGTLIYQADNWPEEFRGHLFTHNLGGHQINQQINRRLGSGFETVHAGKDQLFCTDPSYVAVDLQTGPDGAVYFIDWVDPQHCHNPNVERWDRSNGRMYRMEWQAGFRPVSVNLSDKSDADLVGLFTHRNAWYARTAARLLQERATERALDPAALQKLQKTLEADPDSRQRLQALWTLHRTAGRDRGLDGSAMDSTVARGLADRDEFVRAWTIQLTTDRRLASTAALTRFKKLADSDPSPVVRRALASAIQRVPETTAWSLAESLSRHGEDAEDRNLPGLLWDGIATLLPKNPERALKLATASPLTQLADWIHWYAASQEGVALNREIALLASTPAADLPRRLAGLWLAMEPRANLPMPEAWKRVSKSLYTHTDPAVRRSAERLAAVFGDASGFPRLRTVLADRNAAEADRRHAFAVLSRASDSASLPLFVQLLDDAAFRPATIPLLARFDDPSIPQALLGRIGTLPQSERELALATLTRRAASARALLGEIAAGRLKRDLISAFQIRQLTALHDSEVDRQVTSLWGRIQKTPADKQALIASLQKTFDEAPLWAYSDREGRNHFVRLCSQCHRIGNDGARIGPELTGAGQHGIRYYLENIVDPNAVIGADFQLTLIETRDGTAWNGLVASETPSAVSLKTLTETVVIPKSDIKHRETSDRSLMPEGILEALGERERIELLKYLVTH